MLPIASNITLYIFGVKLQQKQLFIIAEPHVMALMFCHVGIRPCKYSFSIRQKMTNIGYDYASNGTHCCRHWGLDLTMITLNYTTELLVCQLEYNNGV